jgi:hypothetical protein
MYCESAAAQHPVHSESYHAASSTIMDFWARVTPGILQLLSTPKEVSYNIIQCTLLTSDIYITFCYKA